MIKSGGWVKLCWNDFLSKSNKKSEKTLGIVKLCWNDFHNKSTKKLENIWELLNYVGMNFLAKQKAKI